MSGGGRVVSNIGPLISLEKLGDGYVFIRKLYDKLLIPPAVLAEVAEGQCDSPQAYLHHYGIADLVEVRAAAQHPELPETKRLHEGERQAIYLALEQRLPLLIEETVGRRVAQRVGVPISGIAGQVMAAFRQEIVSAAEASSKLGELFQTGRINRKIYEALVAILSAA